MKRDIDIFIEILQNLKIHYTLKILGKVYKNHSYYGSEVMEIRKLQYDNFVVLEKLIKYECDNPYDEIQTFTFTKNNEPLKWELEEFIYYEESDDDNVPF